VQRVDNDRAMKKPSPQPSRDEWENSVQRFLQADGRSGTPEKWEMTDRIFLLD